MIAVIRLRGLIDVYKKTEETLSRVRLRKKFCCVLLKENKENLGRIKSIRNYVTYGKIDKETLILLLEKRAILKDKNKKLDFKKIAEELLDEKNGKKLEDYGIKPFFSLHPPRKGLKSIKTHYPKGDLGDRKEKINDLIKRML
jgi:large subunit ribosomal protein L30